ncbi:hypothetical protein PaeCFBP13512_22870 [Paenibacillus sp. CFBP13512]|uniref:hypothetical protein n=1 Tax=Paenibacillus sp. CFBP13512 TaxID=2184007 RepID=UPI0010C12B4D|nr:hypothetical protein [Paenibacillus sp. CFBP13512]TKJ83399.1 hypothetical protein PaeCFBP13512_22870 [Paenibacillus sp. CFBP13512]
MEVRIRKIAYNLFDKQPSKKEEMTVEISAKFGSNKENASIRAYFFEINIDGKNIENDLKTVSFLLDISFHYNLDKDKFPNLNEVEVLEDEEKFKECLKKLDQIIINIASQDSKGLLRISQAVSKAITEFEID